MKCRRNLCFLRSHFQRICPAIHDCGTADHNGIEAFFDCVRKQLLSVCVKKYHIRSRLLPRHAVYENGALRRAASKIYCHIALPCRHDNPARNYRRKVIIKRSVSGIGRTKNIRFPPRLPLNDRLNPLRLLPRQF